MKKQIQEMIISQNIISSKKPLKKVLAPMDGRVKDLSRCRQRSGVYDVLPNACEAKCAYMLC